MDSTKPFNILFVCMGNICRSPAAEIIFNHLLREEGLEHLFITDSAGTIGFHEGKDPDARMIQTLRKRNYRIFGKSRPLTVSDLRDFDLILVADQENYRDVLSLASKGQSTDHIQLLTDYCEEVEANYVPDPYHGGDEGFEEVADLVEDACSGLLSQLRKKANL